MKLTAITTIKNGLLYEARKKFETLKEFSEFLGVNPSTVCAWMALREIPNLSRSRRWHPEKWQAIEDKLLKLTGVFLEDIFPQELIGAEFLKHPKTLEYTQDVQIERLLDAPKEFLLLKPSQEDAIIDEERNLAIEGVLKTIKPRHERILRLRFGLDDGNQKTLAEVAKLEGVSQERIRTLECEALRDLRHPKRSRALRDHL